MNRFLQTLVTLAWGVWFGGLVVLFLAVGSIFQTFADRHDLAGQAASGIFRVFNGYRLGVAAAALLATFLWRLAGRSRAKVAAFALFALGALAAVYSAAVLTPKIERLRVDGQTHASTFDRLHGLSMSVYLAETIFVLGAGISISQARTAVSSERAASEGIPDTFADRSTDRVQSSSS
ncbi:MAG TPA: DUF4149 domain-containing protein [Tepidisphaeraceae bacterium]|nr:DUF4149 domain-containing protein [Tepidisphaeraceae bacterium]